MAKMTDLDKAKRLLQMGVSGIFLLDMFLVLGLTKLFSEWAQETGKPDPYKKFICFLVIFSLSIVPAIYLVYRYVENRLGLRDRSDSEGKNNG